MKIEDILNTLPKSSESPLEAPAYTYLPANPPRGFNVALGVESMRRHMTNEGWELMLALYENGYKLAGKDCPINAIDVREILEKTNPGTLVIQDKREWMGITADRSRDPSMRFRNVEILRERNDIFKLTIVKDAQHDSGFHREAAEEIGCHAWICYYHPRIVARLAPYVREKHLVRTYHTVDKELIPAYSPDDRRGGILSGAMSKVYPLRQRILRNLSLFKDLDYLSHPGYHRKGCCTPEFLRTLSRYKVSICTSSIYGYALRKIIESTACGCRVITDLPDDEVLPGIDKNLIRISANHSTPALANIVRGAIAGYNPERQEEFARVALGLYDYRAEGKRLVDSIENLRRTYNA